MKILPSFQELPARRPHDQRGVALVLTLSILAMLTVLLVAFVSNVRVERISGRAFSDQLRARLAAQMAVEQAISDLQNATPWNTSPDYTTVAMTNIFPSGVTNILTCLYTNWTQPLYTGNPLDSSYPPNLQADLNAQGYIYPVYQVPHLYVPWAYYTNSWANNNTVTSIRGMTRYAYWIDDESSKININTAGAVNTNASGRANLFDVSSIDLRGLPSIDQTKAGSIVTNRSPPYETVAALATVQNGVDYTALYSNGIAVFATVNSADYERQTNGNVRWNLNDLATNANQHAAVSNIVDVITNAYPAFATKYDLPGLKQIAANLRDYLDTDIIPTDADPTDYSGTNYFGREQVPYLNEIQFSYTVYKSDGTLTGTNVYAITNLSCVEVFNLYGTPFSTNVILRARNTPRIDISWAGGVNTTNLGGVQVQKNVSPLSVGSYNIGPYAVITNIFPSVLVYVPTNISGNVDFNLNATTVTNDLLLNDGAGNPRLDWAIVNLPSKSQFILFDNSVLSALVKSNDVRASVASPGDPRFNHLPGNWVSIEGPGNPPATLGSENQQTPGISSFRPDLHPGNYGDINTVSGLSADNGLPFRNGPMLAVGEIGNIATTTNWSTLKIYGDGRSNLVFNPPSFPSPNPVPDWALLDLFTINAGGAKIAGKININTARDLLTNPQSGGTLASGSLFALLAGVQISPSAALPVVADNTLYQLATNIIANVPYASIGEIGAKASRLYNLGASYPQNTDAQREAVIRALSDITTVRGNAFSIWALGQSIQVVHGQTNIMGEAMIQAIVERTELFDNPPTHMTGATYRIKYMRNVTE